MVQYNGTPPRHQPSRLLEQVRMAIRAKHYSLRTEDTYVQWIRRFMRKYPEAAHAWIWQYVFPAARRSIDPRSGIERRHHVAPLVLQGAVKAAVRQAEIIKAASCHTFRKV